MLDVEKRTAFKPRATAISIDGVLVWGLAILARPVFGSLFGQPHAVATAGFDDSGLITELMTSVSVVGTVYPVIEGVTGRSPGKLLLGYTIMKDDGAPAGIGTLLARSAVKNLGSIASFLAMAAGIGLGIASFVNVAAGVGCLLALGEKRQALHDLLLGTAVFRTRDVSAAARAAASAAATPATAGVGDVTSSAVTPSGDDALAARASMPGRHSATPAASATSEGASRAAETVAATEGSSANGTASSAVPPAAALTPRAAVTTGTQATRTTRGPVTPAAPTPPRGAPRTPVATRGASAEPKQCPKCGLSETEFGTVIGWYCTVCGWRERSSDDRPLRAR